MKVMFIVNPVAGKRKAIKLVPIIKNIMEKQPTVDYSIAYTEKAGHATDISRRAALEGVDIVFAVGGDGTVNETVNGLAGTNCALSVIPGGSGNDFIRSLGVSGSVEHIITGAMKGRKKPIDIGVINGRYFVNISSVGFDGEVVLKTQQAKRFMLSGSAAYIAGLISAIFTRQVSKVRMKIDDSEIIDNTLLVAVANGRYYGGGMKAAPDALLDDGVFDICFIKDVSKLRMLMLFPQFIKGKHGKLREVKFLRSSRVEIQSDKPIAVNIDGEVFRDTKACFEIIEKGLLVAVP